ncbi:MAG TPA: DUF4157 domain-containing protein, partial [Nannocystis exedens]|nr:DUF4157 domain-containing protein [Nannocystis exedens]
MTYAAMQQLPSAKTVLRRPIRRFAAMRRIPVLDVHHPLERDAQVTVARAFDEFDPPRPTSTSSAESSTFAVAPSELQRAPGLAMLPSTREPFEERMGRSFSGVRVHVGPEASALAERLHARAFTHGRDIYFARGEFRPKTREGRGLIAHELAHTLQPQVRGGTLAIARFAASGAAPSGISEEAKKWLDARNCVEPTSPQGLALLVEFLDLPVEVRAEIVAQFRVDSAANSAPLMARLDTEASKNAQLVIGPDGRGGTSTGTREFVERTQSLNQTARGAAAAASNVLGGLGLWVGMQVFGDKERQLAAGEFGAAIGNTLLTGPGTNKVLGYPVGLKLAKTPPGATGTGGTAGQCVKVAKIILKNNPGSKLVQAPGGVRGHVAVQLRDGTIRDPTLRDNLEAHGAR